MSSTTPQSTAQGKVCIICGDDVSTKPRVKNAEGKYLCKGSCDQAYLKQAKSAPPKPAAAPPSPESTLPPGDDIMARLVAGSPMLNAESCSSCGNSMPTGAVICTRCGFNAQTGKATKTVVSALKREKGSKERSR